MSALEELHPFEVAEVARAVGPSAFARGQAYAAKGHVLRMTWDVEMDALSGTVLGRGGLYDVSALFVGRSDGGLAFDEGSCSCPVGWNCKHVAALVVAAARAGAVPAAAELPLRPGPSRRGLPAWEEPLRELIDVRPPEVAGQPLAIELTLQAGGHGRDWSAALHARLLRPGARGGWINGSLAWSALDSWHLRSGDYRKDHLALLQEFSAAERASRQRFSSWYGYGPQKSLDLTHWGVQLWHLLDEAASIGLALLDGRKDHGTIAGYRQGEVVLDVTRASSAQMLVGAGLQVEGPEEGAFAPVLFLGAAGHGVVCSEAGVAPGSGRLRLVRLARPAPPRLQRLVLEPEPLAVPAAELCRFAEEFCPALSRLATVLSSDGSFVPPEVSGPALVLGVRYRAGNGVELEWGWSYRVGAATRRAPLMANGVGEGFRDLAAERAILAATVLIGSGIERHGLLDAVGRPEAGGPVVLAGLEAMRLTSEDLPRLAALPGLAVEVEGEPPDYRDVSQTLTIAVSAEEIDGERDWFGLGVTIAAAGREIPFSQVFMALARGESRLLLDDGTHFALTDPRLQSLRQLIEEARTLTDSHVSELQISRYQADLWSELVALGVVSRQAERWRRQVEVLLELDGLPVETPPEALAACLRPYQRDGFGWLASLWGLGLGGILADDMGLGKTLQALALVCHARRLDPSGGPFLVVAPTSVVANWAAEAERFAPELRVDCLTDTLAKSGRALAAGADLVVTTYTLLRLEAEAYHAVEWSGLVLDEAQLVKNHQAKTYRCVRELSAPFKLALTGTPMENNLMELWSLLSITAPGLFPDPKRFAEQYARPIEREGDRERLARLRRRIKPLVKRRTKELVAADLPAKQEQTVLIDLHPRHRKLYDVHLQRERQRVLRLLDDFDRNRFTILRSITLLRQLSLHPELVDRRSSRIPCAKLEAFVQQLGDVAAGGHRALVFSQFTGFLAKVRERLEREGIGYCYLDGQTRQRKRVLERFKNGEDPAFLISLKAGGVGLNLTEADYCFLLDPWWNPAVENQAIDRTHRLGQTRPVLAYRLIARDTIEEKVVALARRKAELFRGVMDDGDLFAGRLTAEDVRSLVT